MQGIIDNYTARYRSQGKPDWRQWLMDQGYRLSKQEPIYSPIRLPVEELKEVLTHLGEPSYQEVATTAFISEYLLGLGLKLRKEEKLAENETELIVTSKEAPKIYIRCDLDALSQGDGSVSHVCGHAMNMTSVLKLAEMLVHENIHNVGFVFQPAEEGPGNETDGYVHPKGYGGGQYLRAKGIYREVPAIISCHVDTALKTGQVRISEGQGTAAAYRFEHLSQGKVAHAALPWQGVNPIENSAHMLAQIVRINAEFRKLNQTDGAEYGLLTPSQISTPPGELNSLAANCKIRGVSRVSGLRALSMFKSFVEEHGMKTELEAPPVYNDAALVALAEKAAIELGFEIVKQPARFRDETAWAGAIVEPWANPELYPKGCERILHFFVPGGDNCGFLHSPDFNPSIESIQWQVGMLFGIIKNVLNS